MDRLAQHPKRGPDPLLHVDRVVAEADAAFKGGDLPGGGGEDCFCLDAGRGPAVGLAVEAGDDLDGATARELEVGVGGGVFLEVVVGFEAEVGGVSNHGKGKGGRGRKQTW